MTDFEKITVNWNVTKIITYTIGVVSICLTIGYYGGNWQEWRQRTDDRMSKIEKWKDEIQNGKPKYSLTKQP